MILQIIGAIMLAAPFIALFIFMCIASEWKVVVGIYVFCGVLIGWIALAVHLIDKY